MPTKLLLGSLVVNLLLIVLSPILFNFSYEIQSFLWIPIFTSSFIIGNVGTLIGSIKILEDRKKSLKKSNDAMQKIWNEHEEKIILFREKIKAGEVLGVTFNEVSIDENIVSNETDGELKDWFCYKCLWGCKNGELHNDNGEDPPLRCEKCKGKKPYAD